MMIKPQENKITTNSMKSRIHFEGENIMLVLNNDVLLVS